jgi:hypothetical protein
MHLSLRGALAGGALLALPGLARAGMPMPNLTEVSKLRLQSISFFLFLFVLSAAGVALLWNYLQKDCPALPRLSFGKALGLVTLWGLLFVLVLTMISGARELMTPGAWQKQGWTYRLAKDEAPAADPQETARKQKLEDLRFALWDYARTHGGQFPSDIASAGFVGSRWLVPDPSGMRYVYQGAGSGRREAPLAWEPDIFGGYRYVLFASGEIRRLDAAEFDRVVPAGRR